VPSPQDSNFEIYLGPIIEFRSRSLELFSFISRLCEVFGYKNEILPKTTCNMPSLDILNSGTPNLSLGNIQDFFSIWGMSS
jgi:hypothetical protein